MTCEPFESPEQIKQEMRINQVIDRATFQYQQLFNSKLNYIFILSNQVYEILEAYNGTYIYFNKDGVTTLLGKNIKVIDTPGILVAVEMVW